MKIITIFVAFLFSAGCVSNIAHKSWQEARMQEAIRVETDGEQVFIGVDLLSMDYLKDNWKVAVPAAVADAGILYLGYEGVKYIADELNNSGGDNNSVTGDTITITGNRISVAISKDTITTDNSVDQSNQNRCDANPTK